MTNVLIRYSLLIVVGILWEYGYSQDSDIDKSLKMADAQVASGDLNQALLTIEEILAKEPENLDAQEKKLNILVQQNRAKDAMKDIEDYITAYPAQPEFFYLRAILKLQDQKYSKAIEDFDRAIQLDIPKAAEYKVYLNRGMAHFYNQDFDQAEADFSEVNALNPKNAAAYHGKGMVKYELGEYEEAAVEFQKALKLEEDNPITHYNLAMSYYRMKDMENACYHFNRSCALGHRNACRLLMMQCNIDITK